MTPAGVDALFAQAFGVSEALTQRCAQDTDSDSLTLGWNVRHRASIIASMRRQAVIGLRCLSVPSLRPPTLMTI